MTGSRNTLLCSVPAALLSKNVALFKEIEVERSQLLHEADSDISHVYFPTTALICISAVVESGDAVELAMVGREGLIGSATIVDATSFTRATVLVGGSAIRMRTPQFLNLYAEAAEFRSQIRRFNSALIAQIEQNVACNALHSVTQRAASWLLSAQNRVNSPKLSLTQEGLAQSISAHRATVVASLAWLEQRGAIQQSRGAIEICEGNDLQSLACECHRRIGNRYAALLSPSASIQQ